MRKRCEVVPEGREGGRRLRAVPLYLPRWLSGLSSRSTGSDMQAERITLAT